MGGIHSDEIQRASVHLSRQSHPVTGCCNRSEPVRDLAHGTVEWRGRMQLQASTKCARVAVHDPRIGGRWLTAAHLSEEVLRVQHVDALLIKEECGTEIPVAVADFSSLCNCLWTTPAMLNHLSKLGLTTGEPLIVSKAIINWCHSSSPVET